MLACDLAWAGLGCLSSSRVRVRVVFLTASSPKGGGEKEGRRRRMVAEPGAMQVVARGGGPPRRVANSCRQWRRRPVLRFGADSSPTGVEVRVGGDGGLATGWR
jgi:hypothetical protein